MSRRTDSQFIHDVAYYWEDRRDPTACVSWDEERCKKLMPLFYEAWRQYNNYKRLTDLVAADYAAKTSEDEDT